MLFYLEINDTFGNFLQIYSISNATDMRGKYVKVLLFHVDIRMQTSTVAWHRIRSFSEGLAPLNSFSASNYLYCYVFLPF